MPGVVRIQPSDVSTNIPDFTQLSDVLQIHVVAVVTIYRDQLAIGKAVRMILVFCYQLVEVVSKSGTHFCIT